MYAFTGGAAVPRSSMRLGVSALCCGVAAVYVLIAVGAIPIVSTSPSAGDWIGPVVAAAAYLVLGLAVARFGHRGVPLFGVVLCLVTAIGYVAFAPGRIPPYEAWGIASLSFSADWRWC
jgi:hypothetical protein